MGVFRSSSAHSGKSLDVTVWHWDVLSLMFSTGVLLCAVVVWVCATSWWHNPLVQDFAGYVALLYLLVPLGSCKRILVDPSSRVVRVKRISLAMPVRAELCGTVLWLADTRGNRVCLGSRWLVDTGRLEKKLRRVCSGETEVSQ